MATLLGSVTNPDGTVVLSYDDGSEHSLRLVAVEDLAGNLVFNGDGSGNARITLGTLIAGEDLANNRLQVEQRGTYATINTATTTTLKSGPGYVDSINILGGTAGAITVYDNTAGSGVTIWPTFTPGNVTVPVSIPIHATFGTGLTIVTAAATILQVAFR